MAFASARKDELGKVGSGEIIGHVGTVSTYTTFEEGLKGGLFAKYNTATGGVELIDGVASPVVAGVVKREVSSAIEDGGTYTAANSVIADVVESGIITVEVVSGVTPNKFDAVYVYNNTDVATTEWGKATNNATDLAADGTTAVANAPVDGYFYEQIDTNIWSVRIK
jgi:hypothetical protein